MRNLLLLSLLLMIVSPGQNAPPSPDGSAVAVLGFRWFRTRQVPESETPTNVPPPQAMIPENKNYAKNARLNNPVGARDPNEDTIEGRSAAIDKMEQTARTVPGKPVNGFSYLSKIQNTGAKVIEIIFWEYEFSDKANPATTTRRQFLCGVNVKPNKSLELKAFTLSGPSDVVSVASLANNADTVFLEKVLINRVEYADGTIWQRKDWNFGEIRLTYKRAVATPWGKEMCRSL
jgi:hypothetical protein